MTTGYTGRRPHGSFESSLGPLGDADLRSAGFTPGGQVLGTTVFRLSTKGMWNCGATPFAIGQQLQTLEAGPVQDIRAACRRLAFERLTGECASMGAAGVIGANLRIDGLGGVGHEYLATGTAVRTTGRVQPPRPFVCAFDGRRFAAVLEAGWVPVGMAVGVGVTIRHDDVRTRLKGMSFSNQEIPAWTEMVSMARARARQTMLEDCARLGGEGIVLYDASLEFTEHECLRTARNWLAENSDVQDHMACSTMIGTAVVPFAAGAAGAAPGLVLRLDDPNAGA